MDFGNLGFNREVPAEEKNAEAIRRTRFFPLSARDQRRRFEIRVRCYVVESRGGWSGDGAVVRVSCGRFSRGSGVKILCEKKEGKGRTEAKEKRPKGS